MSRPVRSEHGTHARFHAGCKCEPCREAERAYHRAHIREYRRRVAASEGRTMRAVKPRKGRYISFGVSTHDYERLRLVLESERNASVSHEDINEFAMRAFYMAAFPGPMQRADYD
jgi:hypothetical protein